MSFARRLEGHLTRLDGCFLTAYWGFGGCRVGDFGGFVLLFPFLFFCSRTGSCCLLLSCLVLRCILLFLVHSIRFMVFVASVLLGERGADIGTMYAFWDQVRSVVLFLPRSCYVLGRPGFRCIYESRGFFSSSCLIPYSRLSFVFTCIPCTPVVI